MLCLCFVWLRLCFQCCQFLWIVHSWLTLRFSLTFIYSADSYYSLNAYCLPAANGCQNNLIWAYLLKVIPETHRVELIKYLRFCLCLYKLWEQSERNLIVDLIIVFQIDFRSCCFVLLLIVLDIYVWSIPLLVEY